MPRIKLTQRSVERLAAPDPSGKQKLHWDTELTGFAVLCSGVTNKKTYVVQRDLPDGRPRRITIAGVAETTLDEARKQAAVQLLKLRRGVDPKARRLPPTRTLRQALEEYLAARKDLSGKTRQLYDAAIHKQLTKWLDIPLREITPEMVEERHRQIGVSSGGATANSVMRTLRTIWNYAADLDPALPANPVRRLRRQWYRIEARTGYVAAKDLPRFYDAVRALENPVQRDYLLLLLLTGFRRGEAAGLTWSDVDFEHGAIRLPAPATKAKRKLDIPITPAVRKILEGRRSAGEEAFVFPSNSRSGHIEEPRYPLDKIAETTGITVSAHDLRRTYITVAESTDISPLALKALVNHSLGNQDVTSGYVQMTVERLRQPAERVCQRMLELCQRPAAD